MRLPIPEKNLRSVASQRGISLTLPLVPLEVVTKTSAASGCAIVTPGRLSNMLGKDWDVLQPVGLVESIDCEATAGRVARVPSRRVQMMAHGLGQRLQPQVGDLGRVQVERALLGQNLIERGHGVGVGQRELRSAAPRPRGELGRCRRHAGVLF